MMNLIEREYADLRSYRVALRRRRDHLIQDRVLSPQKRFGPGGLDNAVALVEATLRGTERRWTELSIT
jgi:hypothetical protein